MRQASHVIVMTTAETKADAVRLAKTIIGTRLAACVQFWPICSVYRWKGKVVSGQEHLLLCKTQLGAAKSLQTLIKTLHTYELPEIIIVPITDGLPDYLDWIAGETMPPSLPKAARRLTFRRQGSKSAVVRKRGKS